jgi:uncharacterized protein with HEPN domain
MAPLVYDRLLHIKENIESIRRLLAGRSFLQLQQDTASRAALERFLEIISEASRHLPQELKDHYGSAISWKAIAALGNVLRHAYHLSDLGVLWRIYEQDLPALSDAVEAMLLVTDEDT